MASPHMETEELINKPCLQAHAPEAEMSPPRRLIRVPHGGESEGCFCAVLEAFIKRTFPCIAVIIRNKKEKLFLLNYAIKCPKHEEGKNKAVVL